MQALGISFVVTAVAMLVFMSRLEMVDTSTMVVSCGAMVPGMVGMAIGQQLRKVLDEAQFRVLFFIGLLIAGVYMLVRAQLG